MTRLSIRDAWAEYEADNKDRPAAAMPSAPVAASSTDPFRRQQLDEYFNGLWPEREDCARLGYTLTQYMYEDRDRQPDEVVAADEIAFFEKNGFVLGQ